MATKKQAKTNAHRQPIVAILGHVDHGKTTLLDHIRKTRRQSQEAGGITQSIGAYQAEYKNKNITFIDTPGHSAFSKMRSQGANVADIAVLVVAADDGVKPQTVESINHLKKAEIPLVVAINKIDSPGSSPETAKAQLTEHEIFVEGYGGNTPVVEISAKEGKNIEELLENIILLSELEEIPNLPEEELEAVIIEAQKDIKKGPLASVIVKKGTIKVQDEILTSSVSGKVRALFNEDGKPIKEVKPGEPALILGFKEVPKVGAVVTHKTKDSEIKEKPRLENLPQEITSEDKLNLVVRADTLGSLEAIKGNLTDEVNVAYEGTGDITESDVLMASTTDSIIIGFNTKVSTSVKNLAESEEVLIKTYEIIYKLLEYVEKRVLRIMEPTIDEEVLGEAQILKLFDFDKQKIAGCKIVSGKVTKGDKVHLKRSGEIIKDAKISSLKKGKEEVDSVKAGSECGILLFPQLDIKEKDTIISYNLKKDIE